MISASAKPRVRSADATLPASAWPAMPAGQIQGGLGIRTLVISVIDVIVFIFVGKVEAKADVGWPAQIGNVGSMIDQHVERRFFPARQKERRGADPDHAAETPLPAGSFHRSRCGLSRRVRRIGVG